MTVRRSKPKPKPRIPEPKPEEPKIEKATPRDTSLNAIRAAAMEDVIAMASKMYEGGMVLPRIRELVAWMRQEIDKATPQEASDSNSAIEGDDK